MNKLILFLFLILSQSAFGQKSKSVSVFHRLLIYNSNNELLIVKFKDTDIWVTPGFYQDSLQFIKKGLHDVAAGYGLSVSTPQLKGKFSMKSERAKSNSMSIRNMYTCNHTEGELQIPDYLGDAKWMSMDDALNTLTYPHINLFIKQTFDYPNVVWGGSIIRSQNGKEWTTKIAEEFYPLFSQMDEETEHVKNDEQLIRQKIEMYFEGWLTGDTLKIGRAMHSTCKLKNIKEGKVIVFDRATYLGFFSPRPRKEDAGGKIVNIDITANIASAKCELETKTRLYTDYFNLMKVKDEWFIVDKIATSRLKEGKE